MALPALPITEVVDMTRAELDRYFEEYARYVPDAPKLRYAIRFGSRTLFSNDTHDLKQEFLSKIRAEKVRSGQKNVSASGN